MFRLSRYKAYVASESGVDCGFTHKEMKLILKSVKLEGQKSKDLKYIKMVSKVQLIP